MSLLLLIVTLFMLSGCEYHCIKPEDLSGLHKKLDVMSTRQKWVDSGIQISDRIKITEISIIPKKVNFCPNQYKDFIVQPAHIVGPVVITLPFALKAGDLISFSVIGSKMCKSVNGTITYKKIDDGCHEGETEYFAHILNRSECNKVVSQNGEYKYTICPNKLIVGSSTKWLRGQEYWNLNFFKQNKEQEEKMEEIKNLNPIKNRENRENIDCGMIFNYQKSKIDTYILNLICRNICSNFDRNCVQIESHDIDDDGNLSKNLGNALIASDGRVSEVINSTKKSVKEKEIKTYIPSLVVSMQEEELEHERGNIRTNYDYEIKNNHIQGEKLTFILACKDQCKGGYNIRITKIHSFKEVFYIHVSDKFPKYEPGENQADISVDISKVYNIRYMESLKEKLKNKSGTIYYGIKNHGCDYRENEGQFNISLTTKALPTRTFSMIYNFFDEKVKTAFFGPSYKDPNTIHSKSSTVGTLYQNFIALNITKTIRSTISSLLLLYIVLYTFYYFFGLTHISIYEFLILSVKIGIITQLLQDNSWDFFYKNAFSIFINIPKQLMEVANFRGTASNAFEFFDFPLNRFLSLHSILLVISLIFSGPLGIVSFCLVIWGLIIVILSIFYALFSFITSVLIVALLLSLSPIFIIFLLFTYTRQMFHNWIRNLARFAIYPVVLLIFISLISQAMDYIVYSVFDFEVCTTCILNVNMKAFEFCVLYGYSPKNMPNITAIMVFVIFGHAMKALLEASSRISDSLFATYVQEWKEPGKQYQQSLAGLVGLDKESFYRRARNVEDNICYSSDTLPSKNHTALPQIFQSSRIRQGGPGVHHDK